VPDFPLCKIRTLQKSDAHFQSFQSLVARERPTEVADSVLEAIPDTKPLVLSRRVSTADLGLLSERRKVRMKRMVLTANIGEPFLPPELEEE
jgi:hypothetical protein